MVSSQNDVTSERISFATVGRAHGVQGEVRIFLDDPLLDVVQVGCVFGLTDASGGRMREVVVCGVRGVHEGLLVRFEGIVQREEWFGWNGGRLWCDASVLPALDASAAYGYELKGCQLQTSEGVLLGTVLDVLNNAGQALLSVETPSGERLFPLVPETFADFDRKGRVLKVHFIEGVWDV